MLRFYSKKGNICGSRSSILVLLLVCPLFFLFRAAPGNADILDFTTDEKVIVKAAAAWEDVSADVVHFSGGFTLRAPDWIVSSDTADVYGKLDDPEKVLLKGSPAKIYFLRTGPEDDSATKNTGEPEEMIEGRALNIEYLRSTDIVKLSGSATLTRKDDVLASEEIEYNVDTDRYSAGGEGGINIQLNPD